MSNGISGLLLEKLREQVERTEHLISLIPSGQADWHPKLLSIDDPNFFRLNELLFHLTECLAGFCTALYAAYKDQLADFARLRSVPLNHSCEVEEAKALSGIYVGHIEEGFALLTDDALTRQIPTIFVRERETLFTILLEIWSTISITNINSFFISRCSVFPSKLRTFIISAKIVGFKFHRLQSPTTSLGEILLT